MFIGIDLGGTKIEVVVLDAQSKELFRHRLPTPQNNYAATLQAIKELISLADTHCESLGNIGVGIPGAISPATGLIKNANSTCLIGKDLHHDLEKLLRRPVKIANDADCFALSEATDGSGQGFKSVFAVIMGTGVGGGIVINGSLIQGPNAICGEWGHNPLPWLTDGDHPITPCYCGKSGCIETYISGPAFSQRYLNSKEPLMPKQIWDMAAKGNVQAKKHCEQFLDQTARALASVINILDPEIIVLGGGLSNIDILYEEIPHRWQEYAFSDQVSTQLRKAKYGDSSGVRGAAWLWR